MKKLLLINFITVVIVLFGCNSPKTKRHTIDEIQPSEVLEGSEFSSLEPFYNASKLLAVEDYLILYCATDSNFFKVFRLPELKYLYSFGKLGAKSGHFINPDRNSMRIIDNNLVFFDANKVISIKIGADGWKVTYKKPIYNIGEYLNNFQLLNDSTYFTSKVNSKSEYQMMDLKTGKLIKDFGNYPKKLKSQSDRTPPLSYFKSTVIRPNTATIVSFYLYFNKFKIYDGAILSKEIDIKNNDVKEQNNIPNEHNNIVYRVEATATDSLIYTLGLKLTEDVITNGGNKFTPSIEVWDWDGNPHQRYSLNMPITLFCFSEKYNTVYGIHHNDTQKLIQFKLPE